MKRKIYRICVTEKMGSPPSFGMKYQISSVFLLFSLKVFLIKIFCWLPKYSIIICLHISALRSLHLCFSTLQNKTGILLTRIVNVYQEYTTSTQVPASLSVTVVPLPINLTQQHHVAFHFHSEQQTTFIDSDVLPNSLSLNDVVVPRDPSALSWQVMRDHFTFGVTSFDFCQ